jgi:hypothetical protein
MTGLRLGVDVGPRVFWVGLTLYVVSWFTPVIKGQESIEFAREIADRAQIRLARDLSGPPGWQACRFSWEVLTNVESRGPTQWEKLLCGATCLTNVAMLAALLGLASAAPRATSMGPTLVACGALNLSWVLVGEADFRSHLAVGYYLWVAGFLTVGAGLVVSQRVRFRVAKRGPRWRNATT